MRPYRPCRLRRAAFRVNPTSMTSPNLISLRSDYAHVVFTGMTSLQFFKHPGEKTRSRRIKYKWATKNSQLATLSIHIVTYCIYLEMNAHQSHSSTANPSNSNISEKYSLYHSEARQKTVYWACSALYILVYLYTCTCYTIPMGRRGRVPPNILVGGTPMTMSPPIIWRIRLHLVWYIS